jgi:hypothetical protein
VSVLSCKDPAAPAGLIALEVVVKVSAGRVWKAIRDLGSVEAFLASLR